MEIALLHQQNHSLYNKLSEKILYFNKNFHKVRL